MQAKQPTEGAQDSQPTDESIVREYLLKNYNLTFSDVSKKPGDISCGPCECPSNHELRFLARERDLGLLIQLGFSLTAAESECAARDARQCSSDEECVCGGTDLASGECFVGNAKYRRDCVDVSAVCPGFCGNFGLTNFARCVSGRCERGT